MKSDTTGMGLSRPGHSARRAQKMPGIPGIRVCNLTLLASRTVIQETESGLDAVVTTESKGTFLIRRRSGSCPLHSCEIRRIDAGDQARPYKQPAVEADNDSRPDPDARVYVMRAQSVDVEG